MTSPRDRRDELLRAARNTSGPVDTAALEHALVAYREGAATWTEPELVEVVTRRHRVIRALAATTLATKVVLGVATAAAVGGIGVAVTETVHHVPSTPRTTAPSTPSPTPTDTSSTATPTDTTTPTPTMTVTDTASAGTRSPAPTSSPSRRTTPSGSPSTTRSDGAPERSASPTASPPRTAGTDDDDQGGDGDGQGR